MLKKLKLALIGLVIFDVLAMTAVSFLILKNDGHLGPCVEEDVEEDGLICHYSSCSDAVGCVEVAPTSTYTEPAIESSRNTGKLVITAKPTAQAEATSTKDAQLETADEKISCKLERDYFPGGEDLIEPGECNFSSQIFMDGQDMTDVSYPMSGKIVWQHKLDFDSLVYKGAMPENSALPFIGQYTFSLPSALTNNSFCNRALCSKQRLTFGFYCKNRTSVIIARQATKCIVQYPTGSVSSSTAIPTSTPEETLEAFTQALEANDANRALSFLSQLVRPQFERDFRDTSLIGTAYELRKYPPVRWAILQPGERWASFKTQKDINGTPTETHISMYLEGGQWKILSF